MTNPVQDLLAEDKIKKAFSILKEATSHNIDLYNRFVLLSARYTRIEKELDTGIIDSRDEKVEVNKIKSSMLSLSEEITKWPKIEIEEEKINTQMNKLSRLNKVLTNVKKDLENLDFSIDKIANYIDEINSIFEFNLLENIRHVDFNQMLSAERSKYLRDVLVRIDSNEQYFLEKVKEFQENMNDSVSLQEIINLFFKNATIKNWNNLSTGLSIRFSDRSLYSAETKEAFDLWAYKINALKGAEVTNELSFPMEFNFKYRNDFKTFLDVNLTAKNFN